MVSFEGVLAKPWEDGAEASITKRGLVVDACGNAGDRIACGLIRSKFRHGTKVEQKMASVLYDRAFETAILQRVPRVLASLSLTTTFRPRSRPCDRD